MGSETIWIPQHLGTTATPCGGPAAAGIEHARGGAPGAGLGELGVAVAESLAAGRRGSVGSQTSAGAPAEIDPTPTRATAAVVTEGARVYGFPNELWTLKRTAAVIQVEFRVRCHRAHVWKLLRRLELSCQVPEQRAIQRDEPAIAQWKRHKWPAIKKARRLNAHLAFLDESGFLLMPTRRRTWAPGGAAPGHSL